MRAEQPLTTTSSKENIMAANIQTFTQTVTTVHATKTTTTVSNVEAFTVKGATTDDIIAFIAGSNYHYTPANEEKLRNYDILGYMTDFNSYMGVRTTDIIVKVDGQVNGSIPRSLFAERYNQ
jgi:hypothetical protein